MPYFSIAMVESAAAELLGTSPDETTDELAFNRLRIEVARIEDNYPLPPESALSPPITFDIFLSFSSLDARQVLGIYHLLTSRQYVVYLDRIVDPHLTPATVNRATAVVLRRRMAQSRSLFVATSQNTTKSAWVPWELGFFDGLRGKAAVLPIVAEIQQPFVGRSYFELYPEVQDAGVQKTHKKGEDLEIWDRAIRIGRWVDWLGQPRTL